MSKKREQNNTNIDELENILDEFINRNEQFFGVGDSGAKYKDATTRYEGWMMASALSNIILTKKIDKLIKLLDKRK